MGPLDSSDGMVAGEPWSKGACILRQYDLAEVRAPVQASGWCDIPEKSVATLRKAAPKMSCIHEQDLKVAFRINQNRVPLQRGKPCF
jgi:hypothetical protein